jgi:hemerythrin-like domain-containing protein
VARAIKPIAANTSGRGVIRARARRPSVVQQPAATAAVRMLKDEHLAITSVLFGLRLAVGRIGEKVPPDFRLLQALVDYVIAFPERLHHPKESKHLFTALASRCPQARTLIDELEAEHARGAAQIESLQASLATYRREPQALEAFAQAVNTYADFHGRHMEKEENLVFPLALRHLAVSDWERVAAAFLENDNPLQGIRPRREVESLFLRILSLMPATRAVRAAKPRSPTPR